VSAQVIDNRSGCNAGFTWDWKNDITIVANWTNRKVYQGSCGVAPTLAGTTGLPTTCQAMTPVLDITQSASQLSTYTYYRVIGGVKVNESNYTDTCMKKVQVSTWYPTPAPPTPAPPTPIPARTCFYPTDKVTIKMANPYGSQLNESIKNACGTVQKTVCSEDNMAQMTEGVGTTRRRKKLGKPYYQTNAISDQGGTYYTTNQDSDKLGYITHRHGEAVGFYDAPKGSLFGGGRRRQEHLYGSTWGKKKRYTDEYVMVTFSNGYVNSFKFDDLQLCQDQVCKVGDTVHAVYKGQKLPAIIVAEDEYPETYTVNFTSTSAPVVAPTPMPTVDQDTRRRKLPPATPAPLPDNVINKSNVYRLAGGVGMERCTMTIEPLFATPAPTEGQHRRRRTTKTISASALENQAKKFAEQTKRRRDSADGCAAFCEKDTTGWYHKCEWKTCGKCDSCPEVLERKRAYKFEHVFGCANWCKPHPKNWQTKCKYEMCKYCRECVMYQTSGKRRLEEKEERSDMMLV